MAQFFRKVGGEQIEKRHALWLTSPCSLIAEVSGLKISLIGDGKLQVKVLSADLRGLAPLLVVTKPGSDCKPS